MLAVGVLALLLAAPAPAQDLERAQVFAPADPSMYGSGPQPKQGYFFGFDGLWWSISEPDTVPIGYPGTRTVMHTGTDPGIQSNSQNTGPFTATFTGGNRIEFGRVYGSHGWLFSSFRLNNQTQSVFNSDVDMVFLDLGDNLFGWLANMSGYDEPAAVFFLDNRSNAYYVDFVQGRLPVTFDELLMTNRVETWGVELMYLFRSRQAPRGGFFECFAGVRYLEFDDTFHIDLYGTERMTADGNPINARANWRFRYDQGSDGDPNNQDPAVIGPGNVLADSNWATEAENHIVGPQLGGRWFRKSGRWTLSAEGRFFAGLNVQNVRSRGVLGSELGAPLPYAFDDFDFDGDDVLDAGFPYVPLVRLPHTFDHAAHFREFTPGAELRLEMVLDLTRTISVKAGWNAIYLGGIARGSNMNDYTISDHSVMAVKQVGRSNRQDVLLQGLNVGITVNR